jgi:hypothetical protein
MVGAPVGEDLTARQIAHLGAVMENTGFTCWQDGNDWIGFLDEFPDYQTQGTSLEDLKAHLADLHSDLAHGMAPEIREGVRRMEDIITGQTEGLTGSQFRQALGA